MGALSAAHGALAQTLSDTSSSVNATAQSFGDFTTECRATLATKASADDLNQMVGDVNMMSTHWAEESLHLQKDVVELRGTVRQSLMEIQPTWNAIGNNAESIAELKDGRISLIQRCKAMDERIASMEELEAQHYENYQAAAEEQKRAHNDLKRTCEALQKDLTEHVKSLSLEGEKLKAHSTVMYFDQLDKALCLQKSVDKVQKDHRELDAAMRSTKLPKV